MLCDATVSWALGYHVHDVIGKARRATALLLVRCMPPYTAADRPRIARTNFAEFAGPGGVPGLYFYTEVQALADSDGEAAKEERPPEIAVKHA